MKAILADVPDHYEMILARMETMLATDALRKVVSDREGWVMIQYGTK